MKKTLIIIICRPFIFLLIPLITSAQSNISVNIIERTDANKDVNTIFNYSIERFINKKNVSRDQIIILLKLIILETDIIQFKIVLLFLIIKYFQNIIC